MIRKDVRGNVAIITLDCASVNAQDTATFDKLDHMRGAALHRSQTDGGQNLRTQPRRKERITDGK